MKRKSDLLIHPNLEEIGVYQRVNPSSANWKFLSFEARKMKLNRVEYLDKNLKTSRNKDAVFVEFPLIKKGENEKISITGNR